MKLYYSKGACSLTAHILLEAVGRPYAIELVDQKTKLTATGANYTKINPNGYVPALQLDSGEILIEIQAIAQYIADIRPELKLAPVNGTLARYQMQAWLSFINSEVHKNFGPLFHPTSPEARDAGLAKLTQRLNYIDAALAHKPYLMGDNFGAADAYLFNVMLWLGYVHIELTPWPRIADLVNRVRALPAVTAAMKAEGLI